MSFRLRSAVALFFLIVLGQFSTAQQFSEGSDFAYALKLYNEGFYDVSAQQFSTFMNRYPGSDRLADAQYYYADALFKFGDVENARIEFQSLAVSFPQNSRAPEAWMQVGACYQRLGKPQEAAKAYETVKNLYSSNSFAPQALLAAAEIYLEIGLLNRAEPVLREFLDRYHDSTVYPRGRILNGKLLLKKQEIEAAGEEFRRVAELTDNADYLAEARLGEAAALNKLGLTNQAGSILEKIIADFPGKRYAYRAIESLVGINEDRQNWDAALALLRTETPRFSESSQVRHLKLLQARMLFCKNDYFAARKLAGELLAVREDPLLSLTARFYLAACDQEENRVQEALDGYQKLWADSSMARLSASLQQAALLNLARLQMRSGNFSRSRALVQEFEETKAPAESKEALRYDLVRLAFARGMVQEGVQELQQFQSLYPASPFRDDLVFEAGKGFFRAHQFSSAQPYFEQITRDYPSSAHWDSSSVYLGFIKNYLPRDDKSSVRQLARLLGRVLTGENRTELLYELGLIYLRDLKDYQAAAAVLEKYAAQSAGDSAAVGKGLYYLSESHVSQAEYRHMLGQPDDGASAAALAALKKAMLFLRYAPHADTLAYRFLTASARQLPADSLNFLKYWQHFDQTYPTSPLAPQVEIWISKALSAQGNSAQALVYLNKAAARKDVPLLAGRAMWLKSRLYAAQGQTDEALATLKDFLLEFPDHPLQARGHYEAAQILAQKEDFSTAAGFLERLLKLYNYSAVARQAAENITAYYIREGKYREALAYLEPRIAGYDADSDPVARRFLPAPPTAYFYYAGNAYYLDKNFPAARENLLKYLSLLPAGQDQNASLFLLGKMAHEEGDDDSALLQFALIKEDSGSSLFYQANEIAADILFNQGRYADARSKYEKLVSLSTDENEKMIYDARRLSCLAYEGKSQAVSSGTEVFKKTYGRNPQLKTYLAAIEFESGKAAYTQKKFDAAVEDFKTVMKRYKGSSYADDAQYYLGLTYITLNRAKDAMKEFQDFLKDSPQSELASDVYLAMGQIHLLNEEQEEGLAAIRAAVDKAASPQARQRALAALISTNKKLGLWDAALQRAREYISEYPHAADLTDQKISVGIFLSRLNRYSEAVDYLRALKYSVNSEQEPEVQFYIGEAFFNSGQYDMAINEFLKIPLLSQKTKLQWEASALYYSGQSYERLGRTSDAIRMYQEIVDRPGIQLEFKREARKLIDKLKSLN